MKDFTYHNPVQIEFGDTKEEHIGEYIKAHNIKKVLLTYGSDRIKNDGLFSKVVKSLEENDIDFIELGGIQSNPILSKVNEGISIIKKEKIDGLLSVGGGSVLDSTKAISAGACYDGDVWDFFTFKKEIKQALPIFDIITLAATGSEMNGAAVVTNEITKQKFFISSPLILPKVSIVNPNLQKTVSKEYLVYSAVDIIAHSIESYFTATYYPNIIVSYVETNIKTVLDTTNRLLKNKDDYNARAEFSWAATNALNGSTKVGVEGGSYPNHMIEHAISALYNIPHGAGLSIVIPAWMKWYYKNNEAMFERFSREIFSLESAKEGIEKLEEWFKSIGSPIRLKEYKIVKADLKKIANNANENAVFFGLSDVYTPEIIEEILELALS